MPEPISKEYSITDLVNNSMLAYNGGRIQAACRLINEKYSENDVTIGVSLAGALTPAGLGASSLVPLIEHGFIDWIVSTGANMYHDMHFALDKCLHQGNHAVNDCELHDKGIVRIYDIFMPQEVLFETDKALRYILTGKEFQKEMGTQEFYHLLGKRLNDFEEKNNLKGASILASAYRNNVPVFTSSPGDSTIGMNISFMEQIAGFKLKINPSIDVAETTAIVLNAKRKGKSAVFLVGGGSPKNFLLQTEPQIQEILMVPEEGHDYFIQITDARPDTGGLSGATPSEAVSWGKVNPESLENSVIVYSDSTIVLPLITAYILQNSNPKEKKQLYTQKELLIAELKKETANHNKKHMDKLESMLND